MSRKRLRTLRKKPLNNTKITLRNNSNSEPVSSHQSRERTLPSLKMMPARIPGWPAPTTTSTPASQWPKRSMLTRKELEDLLCI